MIMKLVFSLVLSLVLVITASSAILFIDTPSPVLAQEDHGDGDDDDHDDDGGDDHGDDDGDDHGDDHNGDDHGGDGDHNGDGDDELDPQRTLLEGEILGDVEPILSPGGIPVVDAEGNPVLGQPVLDENGKAILGLEGYPMYLWNGLLVSPIPGQTDVSVNEQLGDGSPGDGSPGDGSPEPGQPEDGSPEPGQPEGGSPEPSQPEPPSFDPPPKVEVAQGRQWAWQGSGNVGRALGPGFWSPEASGNVGRALGPGPVRRNLDAKRPEPPSFAPPPKVEVPQGRKWSWQGSGNIGYALGPGVWSPRAYMGRVWG